MKPYRHHGAPSEAGAKAASCVTLTIVVVLLGMLAGALASAGMLNLGTLGGWTP